MISIFNGRSRSLGDNERKDVHLQLDVSFRRYLRLFKGAPLAVFQAIALHMDEKGWSWPSIPLIRKETGYGDDTVHAALNKLEQVRIKKRRVLLRTKTPPPHYVSQPDEGKYARNFYLLFPSDEEIQKYQNTEKKLPGSGLNINKKKTTSEKPDMVFSGMDFSGMEKPDMVFSGIKKNHLSEEEPSLEEETHTHEEEPAAAPAEPTLFEQPQAQVGVCVSPELTKEDYKRFARSNSSFHTPDAWVMTHWPLRDADDLVLDWIERQKPEQIMEAREALPDDGLTFHEAYQRVRSFMTYDKRGPEAIIAELKLKPGVRELLIEKCLKASQGGEGVQA